MTSLCQQASEESAASIDQASGSVCVAVLYQPLLFILCEFTPALPEFDRTINGFIYGEICANLLNLKYPNQEKQPDLIYNIVNTYFK